MEKPCRRYWVLSAEYEVSHCWSLSTLIGVVISGCRRLVVSLGLLGIGVGVVLVGTPTLASGVSALALVAAVGGSKATVWNVAIAFGLEGPAGSWAKVGILRGRMKAFRWKCL